jgi:ketopantoate hydroxymethyltransferase
MSVQSTVRRKTAPEIRARKGGEPIVMLTSYHAHTAALVDRHCDVILVGDSLGNVMHGFETTVPVTLEMMILQGCSACRRAHRNSSAATAISVLRSMRPSNATRPTCAPAPFRRRNMCTA